MFERRSLRLPITLGVVMIVLLVVITVGWVLMTVIAALSREGSATLFWTLLAVGTSLLILVLVGVIMYLTLSIKAINLNQRQTNFVDAVTHELKSPIASLKLYLQTLTRQSVSDDERASFHETMLDDVERLDQLINHLLDAARLERGGRMASAEEIRLDKLLTDCAESVRQRYQFPEERLQLVLRPCIVEAPREDLVIIFRNLLDNALKYAGDEPQVQLVLTSDEQGAPLVQVTDNGRGIPANRRRSIFGRFVRLGRELERDRPGTGLGLYIVRSLVKQLKGQIRVRDGPAGVGTTFEVALPGTWVRTYLEPEPASDVSKLTA